MITRPIAHGQSGYASSHRRENNVIPVRPKIIHLADYESLRRQRAPVSLPWLLCRFWLLVWSAPYYLLRFQWF